MDRPSLVSLFSRILITLCFGIAQPQQFCSNNGIFSVNSTYSINLNLLLSSLPSSIADNGFFYNATVGQGPDKVYALALCREDLPSEKCSSCVNTASQDIQQQYCPHKKEALLWTDSNCLVRYANRDIFAKMEEEISSFCVSNPNDFSGDVARFNKTLHDLMAELITQASSGPKKFATGYVNFTKPIYGLVQCTPDISERDCGICLQKGMGEMESCAGGREGGRILSPSCIVWFELFRFYIIPAGTVDDPLQFPPGAGPILPPQPPSPPSMRTVIIFAKMEEEISSFCVSNPNDFSGDVARFNKTLHDLMAELITQASSGPKKFATGYVNFTKPIYGLVQCTPDISERDCGICLQKGMGEMESCAGGREGGRILSPSCIVWFELFRFYIIPAGTVDDPLQFPPGAGPILPPQPPSPPSPANASPLNETRNKIVIIIVAAVASLVTLVTIICALFLWRRMKQKDENDDEMRMLESLEFNFSSLKIATDEFSNDNKLGQGGFGSVYKGVLPNGQEIAVKRLSGYSSQGEVEFKNEILLLAKLQHRNLVSLVGFCSEGQERILVYEFLGNGSLDKFIFDPIKSTQLNWETRCRIISGIARGILYLHEDSRLRIIHRDLKASNVLLDEEMNPKVSDFGLARQFQPDQTQRITSRVAGTYGYMAPEYALQNRFSVKSDVFSFGVMVLEIVTGKKNSWLSNSEELELLLIHVWRNWREGTATNLIDETLRGSPVSDVMRCLHIGLLCVQENVSGRPTMAAVVPMLNNHSWSLPSPSRPAFLLDSNTDTGLPLLESDTGTATRDQSTENTQGTTYLLKFS
uniref:Cysteine-rich receptor-like protein kinase 29 n=1 Tax=Populus tomentosa TaxID=118781 RepID=A0A1I9W0F0_POPTO|nr:cysteine-rich receptor-like protein kinase 29 [Populus tomentosa]